MAVFAYGLYAQTDFACWNTLISVVPAGNEAVRGRSTSDVKKYITRIDPVLISAFCILALHDQQQY